MSIITKTPSLRWQTFWMTRSVNGCQNAMLAVHRHLQSGSTKSFLSHERIISFIVRLEQVSNVVTPKKEDLLLDLLGEER